MQKQLDRAIAFAESVARDPAQEDKARLVTNALYNAASAILFAWEGSVAGAKGGDARRMLLSRLVLDHRLAPQDPMAEGENRFDKTAAALLLDDAAVSLTDACAALSL